MNSIKKIALLTGGSRGLGRDMALSLAKQGISVIFTYHTNQQAAENVKREIEMLKQKALALQLDTSNPAEFDGFVQFVATQLPEYFQADRIDYLINNAGTGLYAGFDVVTEEQIDNMYQVHFKGPVLLTQKLLPFINSGGGIVNISSGLTRIIQPGSSVYAAMKTAIETQTRYLAKELGPKNIRANVVAPGAIATDFGGGRIRDNENINTMIAQATALGRVGEPEDIGGVVAFLCSDAAYWINGQRIEVSGGQML